MIHSNKTKTQSFAKENQTEQKSIPQTKLNTCRSQNTTGPYKWGSNKFLAVHESLNVSGDLRPTVYTTGLNAFAENVFLQFMYPNCDLMFHNFCQGSKWKFWKQKGKGEVGLLDFFLQQMEPEI